MEDKKTIDWSVILMGLAVAAFLAVVVVIVGGWAFSIGWNSFIVSVFELPEITIGEGVSAMLMLFVGGWALGLRRNSTTKVQ